MLIDSLMMMVRNWLRVPPGASVRHANGPSTSSSVDAENNDYVSTIVDITVDDICLGDEPLSINYDTNTPDSFKTRYKQICDEANSIVKWAARDLCTRGVSVYKASIGKDNKLVLMPDNDQFDFYLTTDKTVVAYRLQDGQLKELKNEPDLLVFLNYRKEDLVDVEDQKVKGNKKIKYKIQPSPMQLRKVDVAVTALTTAENSITKYRALIARPARWVNVDIGLSQGDKENDVTETISTAINAGSDSLTPTSDVSQFDDNIPVIPNRRGIGKPEIVESIPNANLKDVVDLEYGVNKLCLLLRFPASYIDFSKELGQSAVSMIRADLRYSKMCATVRTKLVTTLNDFIQSSAKFKKYKPVFSLTVIPNSEDSDVLDALDSYVDLCGKIEEYVADEDSNVALHRLELLQDLFSTSTSSPAIQKWIEDYRNYILQGSSGAESEGGSDMDDLDSGGEDFGPEGIDTSGVEEFEEAGEPIEEPGPEEVEFIEPQS